jgi:hypothetical protein
MKIIFSFLFCFLFLSCKKSKTFDFPHGEWVVSQFYHTNSSISFTNNIPEYLKNSLKINYSGGEYIYYHSNEGVEKFKIKKIEKNERNNHSYIELTLKNKKFKTFLFEYQIVNDSIIIGDYWKKNQQYVSYDTPNYVSTSYTYTFISSGQTKQGSGYGTFEVLGKYNLKK